MHEILDPGAMRAPGLVTAAKAARLSIRLRCIRADCGP
jgi:hypothetical protein